MLTWGGRRAGEGKVGRFVYLRKTMIPIDLRRRLMLRHREMFGLSNA